MCLFGFCISKYFVLNKSYLNIICGTEINILSKYFSLRTLVKNTNHDIDNRSSKVGLVYCLSHIVCDLRCLMLLLNHVHVFVLFNDPERQHPRGVISKNSDSTIKTSSQCITSSSSYEINRTTKKF